MEEVINTMHHWLKFSHTLQDENTTNMQQYRVNEIPIGEMLENMTVLLEIADDSSNSVMTATNLWKKEISS